jgi:hypothetical protein
MTRHRLIHFGVIVLVCVWTGSAVSADRGLAFSHEEHNQMMSMPCKNCHAFGAGKRTMPNHQLCSICHETEEAAEDAQCSLCHTREDNAVDDLAALFADEVRFEHDPHRERDCSDCHRNAEALKKRMPSDPNESAAPMAPSCDLCHPDPDSGRLASHPAMPFCVDCHQKMGEARSGCAVCHDTITKETIPTHHAGVRIAHDDLDRWETEYAEVLRNDPVFCAYCHDEIPKP